MIAARSRYNVWTRQWRHTFASVVAEGPNAPLIGMYKDMLNTSLLGLDNHQHSLLSFTVIRLYFQIPTSTMHFISSLATVALAATAVVAAPATVDKRADSCSFSGSSGAADAMKNQKSCSTITLNNIEVPAGETLDLSDLKKGTKVVFKGTTTFGYKEWKGPLVRIAGDTITVDGTDATLDGDGSRWWDSKGTNGGKTKPKFFYAHKLNNSVIKGLTIKNSPVQVFSINDSTNLQVNDVTVNNKDGDSNGGHNTDAFDVGSSEQITISGATVYNQDDCLAVNSGTDITFTGGYCSGGHGLSIGSVGGRDDNTVDTVKILDSQIVDSDNGVRIKTVSDATGKVKNVTYKGITLKNVSLPKAPDIAPQG